MLCLLEVGEEMIKEKFETFGYRLSYNLIENLAGLLQDPLALPALHH